MRGNIFTSSLPDPMSPAGNSEVASSSSISKFGGVRGDGSGSGMKVWIFLALICSLRTTNTQAEREAARPTQYKTRGKKLFGFSNKKLSCRVGEKKWKSGNGTNPLRRRNGARSAAFAFLLPFENLQTVS